MTNLSFSGKDKPTSDTDRSGMLITWNDKRKKLITTTTKVNRVVPLVIFLLGGLHGTCKTSKQATRRLLLLPKLQPKDHF